MKGLISTELTLKGVTGADEDEKVGEGQIVEGLDGQAEEVMLIAQELGSHRGFLSEVRDL